MVINGSGAVLGWRAQTNTNWDTVTTNWWNLNSNTPAAFTSGSQVVFDDNTSNAFVNVSGVVVPFLMTFNNNASNYVFSGTGGISGFGGLNKFGSGSLTIGISNTYSGPTIISNGVVTLASPYGMSGSSDTTIEGAKLDLAGNSASIHALFGTNGVVDNSGASPVSLTIGGNGGSFLGSITNSGAPLMLVKGSSASLYLLNTLNGYSGGTTNPGGLLELASPSSIGTGPLGLGGGNLAWLPTDASPHTLTNALAIGGGVTFGNTNFANGPLTVTSVPDLGGNNVTITCDEDVWLPNGIANGTIGGKDGPAKLVLMNCVESADSHPEGFPG